VLVRVWFSVLGVIALVLGVPVGWPAGTSTAQAAAAAQQSGDLAVGIIVDTTNPRSMALAREAGFSHAKMIIHWPRLEPRRGQYAFKETSENDLDNVMRAARAEDMKLVVRVDGTPDWAGGKPSKASPEAIEDFYAALAAHGRGTVVGYEIMNEPNLPFEWGGETPSPAGYAKVVKAAYKGVKKGDPAALVIAGGLSPATGGAHGTMEDVDFLRGMYAAGVRGSMDVFSIHNYGGNQEPERDPGDCGICFRRAELYRQVMVEQGDAQTPIWATEFGWLLDPGRNMGQYDWMRVSADTQADYIVRAYKYARANWPWMTGLLLSNLDASTSPYHTDAHNGMPWFAILNKDHSPRPAWKAFKAWREQDVAQAATRARTAAPALSITPTPAPALVPAAVPQPAPGSTPAPLTEPAAPPPVAMTAPSPEPVAAASVPPAGTAPLRVTKTDGTGVNLRVTPSSTGKPIAILLEGTTVELAGEDVQAEGRTWRQVRTVGSTADGVTGWVAAQYLAP
jgi:hypothetical protein